MEDIQLHGFHPVQVAFNHGDRHEVASGIDHQPAPWKTRLVVDGDHGNAEALRCNSYQLQKGLQSVQHAQRIRRR